MNKDKASGGGAGVETPDPLREAIASLMSALDDLGHGDGSDECQHCVAYREGAAALAQTKPAPEPVAWVFPEELQRLHDGAECAFIEHTSLPTTIPLYAAPGALSEPVAWRRLEACDNECVAWEFHTRPVEDGEPLYASPIPPKGADPQQDGVFHPAQPSGKEKT